MSLDRKSLAQFRVLVALAKVDGKLDGAEEEALTAMLGDRAGDLSDLVAESVEIDEELALLDEAERRRLYQSAFALAYADGNASVHEVSLLKKILPDPGEHSTLGQVLGETLDPLVPGRIVATADPIQREMEITEDTLKYSTLAAVAGAMPLPGIGIIADLAVIAIQTKMVHDIGQHWGHNMDRAAIRAFIGGVAGSAGLRIAINNLSRFVPGWGSAVGATTSFAATYALGIVAQRYFEAGRGLDESELKSLFAEASRRGRDTFAAKKSEIEALQEAHGPALEDLARRLQSGQLTRAEYDAAIASLRD